MGEYSARKLGGARTSRTWGCTARVGWGARLLAPGGAHAAMAAPLGPALTVEDTGF